MVNCMKESLLFKNLMGTRMGFWKRSKLGSMSIFNNYHFWWTIQDYRASGFGGGSFYSKSSSFHLSLEGLGDCSLVFFNFFALWLFLPLLKLELVEVGLSRQAFSNFSLNSHFDFRVLIVGQSKYHPQCARWPFNHSLKRSFLYMIFLF